MIKKTVSRNCPFKDLIFLPPSYKGKCFRLYSRYKVDVISQSPAFRLSFYNLPLSRPVFVFFRELLVVVVRAVAVVVGVKNVDGVGVPSLLRSTSLRPNSQPRLFRKQSFSRSEDDMGRFTGESTTGDNVVVALEDTGVVVLIVSPVSSLLLSFRT
jgi:hypothetical protein